MKYAVTQRCFGRSIQALWLFVDIHAEYWIFNTFNSLFCFHVFTEEAGKFLMALIAAIA
jgi:hypothetical protein